MAKSKYSHSHARASPARRISALLTALLFFIATIFLILVLIGNTRNIPVLNKWYFFKIDVSNIVATALPPSSSGTTTVSPELDADIARKLGLHDFYQVGLWNYCDGFDGGVGVTSCTTPQTLFWFDPVQVFEDQLLHGARITLPSEVSTYLTVIRDASKVMFAFFLASTITSFINVFLCPLAVYSRLWSIPIALFATFSAILTLVATLISTIMWNVYAVLINKYRDQIHIVPTVGTAMLAFMWVAAGAALFGSVIQLGMLCCCASRRDVENGRRHVSCFCFQSRRGRLDRAEKIMA